MRKLPLLLGLAALLAVPAVGQALRGHNVKSPVDVEADRIEVQDRADRAVFEHEHARGTFALDGDRQRRIADFGNGEIALHDAEGGAEWRGRKSGEMDSKKPWHLTGPRLVERG